MCKSSFLHDHESRLSALPLKSFFIIETILASNSLLCNPYDSLRLKLKMFQIIRRLVFSTSDIMYKIYFQGKSRERSSVGKKISLKTI